MAITLVDLIMSAYLRVSPLLPKTSVEPEFGGSLKMGFSSWRRLPLVKGWHHLSRY